MNNNTLFSLFLPLYFKRSQSEKIKVEDAAESFYFSVT